MHLHRIEPAVGGLNYSPVQQDVVPAKPASPPAVLLTAALAATTRSGVFDAFWLATLATVRRMGQRVVAARIARGRRRIESENRRLIGPGSGASDRGALGSRCY